MEQIYDEEDDAINIDVGVVEDMDEEYRNDDDDDDDDGNNDIEGVPVLDTRTRATTTTTTTTTAAVPLQQQTNAEGQALLLLQQQYPYQCCIELTLPSKNHCRRSTATNATTMAQELQTILQVDPELTQQTYKVITTRCSRTSTRTRRQEDEDHEEDHPTIEKEKNEEGNDEEQPSVLVVHFYAQQCKGLRVSISSFLEYIQVALKCYQEFA
jgi:Transcription factor Pcc1